MVLASVALAGCGGGDETSSIPSGADAGTAAEETETAAAAAPRGCEDVEQPEAKPDGTLSRPKTKLDPAKTHTATVTTNCGTFEFELDVREAPQASSSIAYLAERKFYDGTVFHRIVPGFVIQGGDPTGTGTGGPGYKTVDKPSADAAYTRGVVAMAKGGDEPAGTAGSQFFVVIGADAQLPPDYAVVGEVTKGLDVVRRIGQLGDEAEQPTFTVVIESFRVVAS